MKNNPQYLNNHYKNYIDNIYYFCNSRNKKYIIFTQNRAQKSFNTISIFFLLFNNL